MPRTAPPVIDPPPPAKPSRSPAASASPSPSAPKARRPRPAPVPRSAPDDDLPPLCNGDRLTQPEFHRRYLRMPETVHAELIEGMVFIMASPIRADLHSGPQSFLMGWLFTFAVATPGTKTHGPSTLIIDNESELEPDALLRLTDERVGGSRLNEDGYIAGVPELVVEVAASSAAYDLNAKKRVYARIGVPEYIVATAYERAVHWFVLTEGAYIEIEPDGDGIYRSRHLAGLWLPASALWDDDATAAVEAVHAGVATDAHAVFVARLAAGPDGPAVSPASKRSKG